ncbi:MAG: CHAT domain-containing protein [Aureispira sp.]|nr:CHAT domain-containing protein [Aureispira sp.]
MLRILGFILLCSPIIYAQSPKDLTLVELDKLAYHYHLMSLSDSSDYYLDLALEASKKGPKDSSYIKRLGIQAGNFINKGELEKSQEILTTVFELWESQYPKQHYIYARLLGQQAILYLHQGDLTSADKITIEMMDILDKNLQHHLEYGYACYLAAYIGLYSAKPSKYIENQYLKAQSIFVKHLGPFHPESLNALNGLADYYAEQNKYEEAVGLYQKIIKNYPFKEDIQYIRFLNHLAYTYQEMNWFDEAEALFLQALELSKNIDNTQHSLYANLINNIGHLYQELHQYTKAEAFFLEAKDIYIAIGEEEDHYHYVLSNLALCYHQQGHLKKAQAIYQQSLEFSQKRSDIHSPDYALSLNNLAGAYLDQGKWDEAKSLFLEITPILEQHQDYVSLGINLNNLAAVFSEQEDYVKAEFYNQKALKLRQKLFGHRHSDIANTHLNFAKSVYKQGLYTSSVAYCQKAIITNSPSMDSNILLPTLIEQLPQTKFYSSDLILHSIKLLYKSFRALYRQTKDIKQLEQAHTLCKQTILLIGQQQDKRSVNEDKLDLAKNSSFFVGELIQSAIDLSEQTKNPSHIVNALYYMEHNKTLLLTDALKAQRARSFGDLPDSLALKEMHLQHQQNELQQQLLTTSNETVEKELRAILNKVDLEINIFKEQIEKQFPKYFKLRYAPIFAKVSDLQPLLKKDAALLEYVIVDSTVYLFYIDAQDFAIHPIELNKNQLDTKIKELRLALSDYYLLTNNPQKSNNLYAQNAHWFYQILVAPALHNKTQIKHLTIVPDGELGHLPFEVFLTEATNSTDYANMPYLLQKYSISYDYSATMFKENMQNDNNQLSNDHLLGFAASYSNMTSPDFRAPHLKSLYSTLKPLPATQQEIDNLSKKFNGVFAKGSQANEAFFKEQAPRFGIIHLAMHGILNRHHPILSGLAFTENKDSIEDNFLQAYEISHMQLNAALVVLSACETGYGKFQRGEGVMSLARSFMYAGVPSLVVSLWQINDQATAMLMEDFYKNLMEGESKADALRNAKLQFLKNAKGISAHPAFWSALVQLGNYTPISIQKKTNYWWYISIGLGLAFGYFAIKGRKRAA